MSSKPRPIDDIVVEHLAAGASHAWTAKQTGVSTRTIFRRLQDPVFAKRVNDRRGQMLGQTVGRLCGAAPKAVETLEALLSSESQMVALSAAKAILESVQRLRADIEFSNRLDELERKSAAMLRGGA